MGATVPPRECDVVVVGAGIVGLAVARELTQRHQGLAVTLVELERRGNANGVEGLRRIGPDELREIEPHATGIAALHSPDTGVVDYSEVAASFAGELREGDGEIVL